MPAQKPEWMRPGCIGIQVDSVSNLAMRAGWNARRVSAFRGFMKYHVLPADICCPFCGRPNLVYKRPGQHGDIYRCAAEWGGCERTILHRRQKGKLACGITPILNFGALGAWKACSDRDS